VAVRLTESAMTLPLVMSMVPTELACTRSRALAYCATSTPATAMSRLPPPSIAGDLDRSVLWMSSPASVNSVLSEF